MYTPMSSSAVVQTNGASQLFASTSLPSAINIPSPNLSGTINTTLGYNSLVQTDGSANLKTSLTLPNSCSLSTASLVSPTLSGTITASGFTTPGIIQNSASGVLSSSLTLPNSCSLSTASLVSPTLSGTITASGFTTPGIIQNSASGVLSSTTNITISQINSANASPYNLTWNGGAIIPLGATSDLGSSTTYPFRNIYATSVYATSAYLNSLYNTAATYFIQFVSGTGWQTNASITPNSTSSGVTLGNTSLPFNGVYSNFFQQSSSSSTTNTFYGAIAAIGGIINAGATTLGLTSSTSITLNSSNTYTTGNISPSTNNSISLGSSIYRFVSIFSNIFQLQPPSAFSNHKYQSSMISTNIASGSSYVTVASFNIPAINGTVCILTCQCTVSGSFNNGFYYIVPETTAYVYYNGSSPVAVTTFPTPTTINETVACRWTISGSQVLFQITQNSGQNSIVSAMTSFQTSDQGTT